MRKCPTSQPERDNCCGNTGYIESHPQWSPYSTWDLGDDLDDINNCYSYAFNDLVSLNERDEKLQPGELSGEEYTEETCESLISKFKRDYPQRQIKPTTVDEHIECDRYKIGLAVASDINNFDYHFYRQDLNGLWSHKPGSNDATNVDASNRVMSDPQNSDRDYTKYITEDNDEEFNYDMFCGYFSLKVDPTQTLHFPPNVQVRIIQEDISPEINTLPWIFVLYLLLILSLLISSRNLIRSSYR